MGVPVSIWDGNCDDLLDHAELRVSLLYICQQRGGSYRDVGSARAIDPTDVAHEDSRLTSGHLGFELLGVKGAASLVSLLHWGHEVGGPEGRVAVRPQYLGTQFSEAAGRATISLRQCLATSRSAARSSTASTCLRRHQAKFIHAVGDPL